MSPMAQVLLRLAWRYIAKPILKKAGKTKRDQYVKEMDDEDAKNKTAAGR